MMKHRAAAHTLRYCARPWALRQNKGRQLALGTQHYTTLSELAVASADPGAGGLVDRRTEFNTCAIDDAQGLELER
jgi:hypothetical protein